MREPDRERRAQQHPGRSWAACSIDRHRLRSPTAGLTRPIARSRYRRPCRRFSSLTVRLVVRPQRRRIAPLPHGAPPLTPSWAVCSRAQYFRRWARPARVQCPQRRIPRMPELVRLWRHSRRPLKTRRCLQHQQIQRLKHLPPSRTRPQRRKAHRALQPWRQTRDRLSPFPHRPRLRRRLPRPPWWLLRLPRSSPSTQRWAQQPRHLQQRRQQQVRRHQPPRLHRRRQIRQQRLRRPVLMHRLRQHRIQRRLRVPRAHH